MQTTTDLPPNISDHDLLIVLHTTMKHMSADISSIKDDSTKRLAVVEATKYDKEDAQAAQHAASKVHEQLAREIAARQTIESANERQKKNDEVHADHEKRQRAVERNMYMAVGALALLQIILANL